MLKAIIDFSLKNKFIVLLATVALTLGGLFALRNIPLDAIPDLSDTQVIIYTEWPGQAPQIVQDQVTYPLTTKMLSVPKAKVVRGYSFYGFSFVYVIFEDGTDPYWARSRVLEYLSGLSGRLPKGVSPSLGPDATGVGWAFMYSLNSKERSLAELRSMQDWYLKYQLTSVEGVAEVASIGGFVKQYQVTVDPTKLRAYNLSIAEVSMAIKKSNGEVGGRFPGACQFGSDASAVGLQCAIRQSRPVAPHGSIELGFGGVVEAVVDGLDPLDVRTEFYAPAHVERDMGSQPAAGRHRVNQP